MSLPPPAFLRTTALALALGLLAAASAGAQVGVSLSGTASQVRQLAPQLVAFAGSQQNFASLVDGLAQGLPVTLVSQTATGFTQTVRFTPAGGPLSPVEIARTLEGARQQLISRGVAAPTAEQLGVALTGERSASVGASSAAPVVTNTAPLGAGTAPAALPPNAAAPRLSVDLRPTAPQQPNTSASPYFGTSDSPIPSTSFSPTPRGTSDSPIPATGVTVPLGPGGASPAAPNGPPSPAARMQGRR